MISPTKGRRALLVVVLGAMAAAFLILYFVGRGGAISQETALVVIKRLLDIYVPLLGIMAGFYFSERGENGSRRRKSATADAFLFGITIVGTWVILPPVFIMLSETVDAALRLLEVINVYGSTLAAGVLAFYFSKSGVERTS